MAGHMAARRSAGDEAAPDDEGTAGLLARIRLLAAEPGLNLTTLDGISVFRSDADIGRVRGHAPVLSLAIAASGSKTVRCGACTEINDASHVLVMHGGRSYDAAVTGPYVALKVQLAPELIGSTLLELAELGELPEKSLSSPPAAFVGQLDRPLTAALLRLIDCLGKTAEQAVVAPLILREISFHLLRSEAASMVRASITREHLRIFEAMRLIEARAGEALSVSGLARAVAMSPSNFAHRFRELAGVSPMQYLKSVRLARARVLILDQTRSVAGIAEISGYASTSHFTQDFRRQYGMSPARYAEAFHKAALLNRPA